MPLLILLLLLIASAPSCSPAPTPRPATRPSSTSIPSTNRGSPPGGLPFIRSVTGRVRRATAWRTPTSIPASGPAWVDRPFRAVSWVPISLSVGAPSAISAMVGIARVVGSGL